MTKATFHRLGFALVGLALLTAPGLAQQEAAQPLTVNLTVSGEIDESQIYVLRYAVLDGDQPSRPEQIQLCGSVAFPAATTTLSQEACRADETYTFELDIAPGEPVAIQVVGMQFNDPENGYRVLMQTFEGEMPTTPDDFTEFPPGTTHWIWVAGPQAE